MYAYIYSSKEGTEEALVITKQKPFLQFLGTGPSLRTAFNQRFIVFSVTLDIYKTNSSKMGPHLPLYGKTYYSLGYLVLLFVKLLINYLHVFAIHDNQTMAPSSCQRQYSMAY